VAFHSCSVGGFRPGEKWTVTQANCETVMLERNGKVREFKPSAKGKWDVFVSSTMQVSKFVNDSVRPGIAGGFRSAAIAFSSAGDQRVLTCAEPTAQDLHQTRFGKISLLFGRGLPVVRREQDVPTLRY
jgi:hypothetical protein